jgi:hypothetical protein
VPAVDRDPELIPIAPSQELSICWIELCDENPLCLFWVSGRSYGLRRAVPELDRSHCRDRTTVQESASKSMLDSLKRTHFNSDQEMHEDMHLPAVVANSSVMLRIDV